MENKKDVGAVKLAITGASIGVAVKFAAGLSTGSMSLLSSAADSLSDLLVSAFNLFAVKLSGKEADADHNYGHQKIEGLGAMFE